MKQEPSDIPRGGLALRLWQAEQSVRDAHRPKIKVPQPSQRINDPKDQTHAQPQRRLR